MSNLRVLYVTQEMDPYTAIGEMSDIVGKLPGYAVGQKMEVRVLMPRFGTINERRHKLHEVVRLSGMIIIVDDDDFPLIIKVASLPKVRIQVYFLDNEEFFKRKSIFQDEEGNQFEDNQNRTVFFNKGTIEIVRKFGWAPDIIHCHGWMTSLVPLYIKTVYKNDPIFNDSKIIFSVYNNHFKDCFNEKFGTIACINDLEEEQLVDYIKDGKATLNEGGILHADAIIIGEKDVEEDLITLAEKTGKPMLPYNEDPTAALTEIISLYNELAVVEEEEESIDPKSK